MAVCFPIRFREKNVSNKQEIVYGRINIDRLFQGFEYIIFLMKNCVYVFKYEYDSFNVELVFLIKK